MSKLNIADEMRAVDSKNRDFYDNLTDDERKQFSSFLMIRWGSSVASNADVEQYYLLATNERLNKNFFSIKKEHDKLNWLATTTISPGVGNLRHEWISAPKRASANGKVEKFLTQYYPDLKADDIALMASLNDLKTIKKYAEALGMNPDQIKKELG